MRTMPSMSPLLLALLAFGCSQDPGEGELLVVAYGESFIEDGIPAAEMDDGWAITFDRFDVVIADVSVGGSSLDAGDTLDLAQPSNGEGQQLGSLTVPAGDHSDASFQLDAVSLAGTATLGGVTKQFDWSFEPNVHYSDCEAVTTVPDGGQGALELTLHGDHFFFDSLVSGEPAVVFQALADADTDGDDVISTAELQAADIGAYDPGSAADVTDLWGWLGAQSVLVGHVDGEGHCDSHVH